MGRLIETPPLGAPGERLITLVVLVFFAIHLSIHRAVPGWLLASFFLLTLAALCIRAVQPLHLSLFCSLWLLIPLIAPALSRWPFYKVTPLAVYAGVLAMSHHLRNSVLWFRPGRLGIDTWLFVALVVVVSSGALVVWNLICRPDLAACQANIPPMPLWLLPLAGVSFALLNSAVEEAIFRGVMLQALDSAVGVGTISLTIQAVFFGWLHYSEVGCPKGLVGVVMASVYGLILGYLRYRSSGILAPWLAHAGTDLAVFTLVATSPS
jgi:membrane protease YdiL (CAAX protease family)